MKIIIEEDCANYEYMIKIGNIIKPILQEIVDSKNIDTLEYFVISNSEDEKYFDTVAKFAVLLNTEETVENSDMFQGAGKTIEGINQQGQFGQAIIIKSDLIGGLYCDLLMLNGINVNSISNYELIKNKGLMISIHEIGHVINNQNIFNLIGSISRKIKFNLPAEYDEYIRLTALSLWGEYFAESVPCNLFTCIDVNSEEKMQMLIDCIDNYYLGEKLNNIINRIYRIIYLFMHIIARNHFAEGKKFDYEKLQNSCVLNYNKYLEKIEISILNLYEKYPNWNIEEDLKEFIVAIEHMVEFEYAQ